MSGQAEPLPWASSCSINHRNSYKSRTVPLKVFWSTRILLGDRMLSSLPFPQAPDFHQTPYQASFKHSGKFQRSSLKRYLRTKDFLPKQHVIFRGAILSPAKVKTCPLLACATWLLRPSGISSSVLRSFALSLSYQNCPWLFWRSFGLLLPSPPPHALWDCCS